MSLTYICLRPSVRPFSLFRSGSHTYVGAFWICSSVDKRTNEGRNRRAGNPICPVRITKVEWGVSGLRERERETSSLSASPFSSTPKNLDGKEDAKKTQDWVQWLTNLEIPVCVRSLKSSNVELVRYLNGRRVFKWCLRFFFFSSCWPSRDHIGRSIRNFNQVMTSSACRWFQGLYRSQIPCTPSLYCPIANSAQHRANNQ